MTVEFQVEFRRGRVGQKILRNKMNRPAEPASTVNPAGAVPRVARLMALAISIDERVRRGEIRDFAEAARVGHVTRARMTQVLNLVNLSPGIQEAILFLTETVGRDPIGERDLRPIASEADWGKQREMWRSATEGASG